MPAILDNGIDVIGLWSEYPSSQNLRALAEMFTIQRSKAEDAKAT